MHQWVGFCRRSWLRSLQLGLQPGFGLRRGLKSLKGPPIRERHLNFGCHSLSLIKSWVFCNNELCDEKWLLDPAFIKIFGVLGAKCAHFCPTVTMSDYGRFAKIEPCQAWISSPMKCKQWYEAETKDVEKPRLGCLPLRLPKEDWSGRLASLGRMCAKEKIKDKYSHPVKYACITQPPLKSDWPANFQYWGLDSTPVCLFCFVLFCNWEMVN